MEILVLCVLSEGVSVLFCLQSRCCAGSGQDALVHPGSSSEPVASLGIERVKSKSAAAFLPNSKKLLV